jgi:hypothetical protein
MSLDLIISEKGISCHSLVIENHQNELTSHPAYILMQPAMALYLWEFNFVFADILLALQVSHGNLRIKSESLKN